MGEGEKTKILVVDDEEAVRSGLVDNLKYEGYEVLDCADGLSALSVFQSEKPDLVILDVMMPGLDGLEVCRRIRAEGLGTPVIMLTAKGSEVDKVVGLEMGADDYLAKPFGMRELFARIKALLRRARAFGAGGAGGAVGDSEIEDDKPAVVEIGGVRVDFIAYSAKRGDEEIFLSAREFELLRYLVAKPDIPVTRDELLDHVWGYNSYPTTRTVDNFIARLRQKIEEVPESPRHLLTVHGVGYKFVGQKSETR